MYWTTSRFRDKGICLKRSNLLIGLPALGEMACMLNLGQSSEHLPEILYKS